MGILTVFGLRAASGLLGAWMDSAGRILILGTVAAGGLWIAKEAVEAAAWKRGAAGVTAAVNAETERAVEAAKAEGDAAVKEDEGRAKVDRETLQKIEADKRRLRDATGKDTTGKGGPAVIADDDEWLRAKRAKSAARD